MRPQIRNRERRRRLVCTNIYPASGGKRVVGHASRKTDGIGGVEVNVRLLSRIDATLRKGKRRNILGRDPERGGDCGAREALRMGALRGRDRRGRGRGRSGGRVLCPSRTRDRGRAVCLARKVIQPCVKRKRDVGHLDELRSLERTCVEGGATMRRSAVTLAGRGLRPGLSPAMGTAARLLATA